MKDAFALAGRHSSSVVGMLAVLVGIVNVSIGCRSTLSAIKGIERTHIYPSHDEKLTLKCADGHEFDVDLTGVRLREWYRRSIRH